MDDPNTTKDKEPFQLLQRLTQQTVTAREINICGKQAKAASLKKIAHSMPKGF
jgi:hypothetical protein